MAPRKSDKDPFENLDQEFKDKVAASSVDQIREIIATVALNELENQKAKQADLDLAEKQNLAKALGAKYSDETKLNNKRVKARKLLLEDPHCSTPKPVITREISEIVLAQVKVEIERDLDEELATAKQDVKEAGQQYSEASKMNDLRVQWCRRVLHDRGAAV